MVKQWTHNPLSLGSIPSGPTNFLQKPTWNNSVKFVVLPGKAQSLDNGGTSPTILDLVEISARTAMKKSVTTVMASQITPMSIS